MRGNRLPVSTPAPAPAINGAPVPAVESDLSIPDLVPAESAESADPEGSDGAQPIERTPQQIERSILLARQLVLIEMSGSEVEQEYQENIRRIRQLELEESTDAV
jgi:hypothetical protein